MAESRKRRADAPLDGEYDGEDDSDDDDSEAAQEDAELPQGQRAFEDGRCAHTTA